MSMASPEPSPTRDSGLVQLGTDLWVDLDAGLVLREQRTNPLTARETHILRILVQSFRNGRRYITAQAIAERIRLSDPDTTEHAIEQVISSIRRKLGETAYRPRILQGRRGFGYRLFPDFSPKSHPQPDIET